MSNLGKRYFGTGIEEKFLEPYYFIKVAASSARQLDCLCLGSHFTNQTRFCLAHTLLIRFPRRPLPL